MSRLSWPHRKKVCVPTECLCVSRLSWPHRKKVCVLRVAALSLEIFVDDLNNCYGSKVFHSFPWLCMDIESTAMLLQSARARVWYVPRPSSLK